MSSQLLDDPSPVREAAAQLARSLPRTNSQPSPFRQVWHKLADAGVFEELIPEGRLDWERAVATLEGLGEGCAEPGLPIAIGAHCFGVGAALSEFEDPSHDPLFKALRDGSSVGALAATEVDAGSDIMALKTLCRPSKEGFVISGEKRFVTNAVDADLFLILATRDPREHFRGVNALIVPSGTPGITVTPEDMVQGGLDGCSIGTLSLNEVTVPRESLVVRPGGGAKVFRKAMLWERTLIGAAHLGRMRRQLADTLAFTRERRQFGRPIGANQYVAGRVVDMVVRYRTARLLVYDSARRLSEDHLHTETASLTKLYVSEAAVASSLDALRLTGGAGLLSSSSVSRDLSASLAGLIYSGTSEIQKVIVASALGLGE